ncbi:MAG: hypothetical protein PVJ55_05805 [Anaerolineae bacterium]
MNVVVETVRMTAVILLTLAAALSGCAGAPGAITSSPPDPAPSPTVAAPTTPAEAAQSGCADLELPALVVVPPPGQGSAPRRFILVGPDGEERCRLGAPYVPWRPAQCQVEGKRMMCWDETRNALQVLDVRSGEIEYVVPELKDEEARLDFLVSPDGTRIVWSTTVDAHQAYVQEGTRRCRVTMTHADGSEAEIVLEEQYDKLHHLVPFVWMPWGEAIYFARKRVWVESGGGSIPAFSGRYSELYRLHVASGEFQKVFPSYDVPVCNRCISDVSSDGHWLAYHGEDGSLILRDLVSGGEMLVADASNACYLGHARFGPNGEHLVYTELKGRCDERDTFEVARTVTVNMPPEGHPQVLAKSTEAVDWPVGWLDGETPVFDRVYQGFDERGLWLVRHPAAGRASAAKDLLPRVLIGVLRPPDPERHRSP